MRERIRETSPCRTVKSEGWHMEAMVSLRAQFFELGERGREEGGRQRRRVGVEGRTQIIFLLGWSRVEDE